MARAALYNIYRPHSWDSIVEQDAVKQIISQQIKEDNLKRVLLFTGGAGTGKTTSARVLARDIEKEPSNIVEINCADHTGVDDVRQLVIDASRTRPLTGKYKIFVLDEVHMLTVQAQNALLKILEEPPSHCIYILCTTDPQKILGTIMSRAFRYDFQLISLPGIIARLKYILEEEKKLGPDGCGVQSWDDGAVEAIAISANGHMRNAIATMEKCISYSRDLTVDGVTKVLGTTNYDTLFHVLDSILGKQESNLINQLDEINNSGMDLKLFIKNFLAFIIEINKYIIIKTETGQSVVPQLLPSSYSQRLSVYNASHKEILKHLLKTMLELNSEIRWETNVKPVLETKLLLEVL